jgi:hypothetical protein
MQYTDGPLTFHLWNGTVSFVGNLALAAGACTIAAGVLTSRTTESRVLVVNGLAVCALGLIQASLFRYPIGIFTIASLLMTMSTSSGVLELAIARTLQHNVVEKRLLRCAGVASTGFALVFLALGLRWIKIQPGSHADLLWISSYFGFNAVCMLPLGRAFQSSTNDFSRAST